MYRIRVHGRYIELSEELFNWLWPLRLDMCGPNPLKHLWPRMSEDEYKARTQLYRMHLIDCYGNLTDDGLFVVNSIFDNDEAERQCVWDVVEMQELDRLDLDCRKRPRYTRYDG